VQGRVHGWSSVAIVLAALAVLAGWLLAPSTATAARSEFFGIVQGPSLDEHDLQGMAAAGVRTNRFVLNWGWIQPDPGSFRWGSLDRFIGRLASHGIRPAPALWGNPDWVYGSAARPPLNGQPARAWQLFLGQRAARYGAHGSYWVDGFRQRYGAHAAPLPIRSWQIWNEPNLPKYFAPRPSPREYARLLQISHEAIKNRDPGARIVLAGMPGHGEMEAWDFLDGLYSVNGIKARFDAAALHPYARGLHRQSQHIARVRAVMSNHGDQATPLWLTELGWGSAPADRFGVNKGPEGQAQSLSGSLKLVLRHREAWNVERLFWFHWRDPQRSRAGPCSFCASAGLLTFKRTAKLAYPKFLGFTAESTPPEASIRPGPGMKGLTSNPAPRFSFASNEPGSTFVCRFDAQPYHRCSSPFGGGAPLPDGDHTFDVKAIDAPGNMSAVASRPFTVDTQAPMVTMSSGPASGSTSSERDTSFSFASNESGASFSCKLDRGGFEACASPYTASDLTDASHTFMVKATDRAGNLGPVTSRVWTVDRPGDVSITDGPRDGDFINDRTPSFGFSSTDSGAGFHCKLDGGQYAPCSSPYTVSRLAEGDHRFMVEVTDTAQNTAAASRDFIVDSTAPVASIASGPAGEKPTNDPTPTFRLSSSEARSTFQCHYERQRFSACSGPRSDTPASALSDGPHTFHVRAIDAAGNRGAGVQVNLEIDTAAPQLAIERPAQAKAKDAGAVATFTLRVTEQAELRCRVDSRPFRSCSERYRTPRLAPGTHALEVTATDPAGNLARARRRFQIAGRLSAGVPLTAPRAPDHPHCHGLAANLIGSPHSDRLVGTSGRDVIVGFGGDDRIRGRGGRDWICGRRGDDWVRGGRGGDHILAGPGDDNIRGGIGRDMTRGGGGLDLCRGAPASRRFLCEPLAAAR
jgi:hypothetical protein